MKRAEVLETPSGKLRSVGIKSLFGLENQLEDTIGQALREVAVTRTRTARMQMIVSLLFTRIVMMMSLHTQRRRRGSEKDIWTLRSRKTCLEGNVGENPPNYRTKQSRYRGQKPDTDRCTRQDAQVTHKSWCHEKETRNRLEHGKTTTILFGDGLVCSFFLLHSVVSGIAVNGD